MMRKLLLLAAISCSKPKQEPAIDLASNETTAMAESYDTAPGAAGAAGEGRMRLSLDEGKMGRREAIEQARSAGILGGVVSGFDATESRDKHADLRKNPWTEIAKDRLSTFAADVDTASYTFARKRLEAQALPDHAAIRVEEFVNYFRYTFAAPTGTSPFSVVMEAAPSPLAPQRHVVRVGVATRPIAIAERKPAHLVFLVDVSGSMDEPDKLPLAKQALHVLASNLGERDTVSLVTYAGSTRVVLEPTPVSAANRVRIDRAIDALSAAGSTAMASGIDLAYARAVKQVHDGHISRVVVLSDGDANVGPHTHDEILKLIAGRAKEGVTLSTIGFGVGNYNDELMEQLADKGNGNNFYIDSLEQARRVFTDDLTANIEVVAKDVKLQVDFDPALVARYRLLGYENRDVADADFRNDKVDAGEIGAGHQVTALYELELTAKGKQAHAPLGAIRIRYKAPQGAKAMETAFPMAAGPAATFAAALPDTRFAFAVAAFADVLRGGPDAEHWSLWQIRDIAKSAAGTSTDRAQLVSLIERAMQLTGRTAQRD